MLLDLPSADRIGQEVARVLRDAGIRGQLPTPVDEIVAAAGLRLGCEDIFDERILANAPTRLREAVKGLSGRLRAMLDRREREVYVHPQVQIESRRRFQTLHEVGHDILPWQAALAYADDDRRLSLSTKMKFEQEANQAAAELLFQQGLFTKMASDYRIGFAAVLELSQQIGASIHSATRRYAEHHAAPVCALVLDQNPISEEPLAYRRREAVHSISWGERFTAPSTWPSRLTVNEFGFLSLARQALIRSPVSGEWTHSDRSGASVRLRFELFSNSYRVFVLIWVPQRERSKKRRIIVPGA